MLLEAECRKVLAAAERCEVDAILLKGSALAHWAYDQAHLRACGDIDLLVPSREEAERLATELTKSGFTRAKTSGELVAFELMCFRKVSPDFTIEADIHWKLVNSALFADTFSRDELIKESVEIPSLGKHAKGLGPVHAMLHAAMHRSRNLTNGAGDLLKWLYDFVVIADRFDETDWQTLQILAIDKQIAGVTLSALEATQEAFSVAFPESVLDALRQASAHENLDASRLTDWRYMQTQTLHALPGLWPKMRWLWQRLFPSRDYMTYLYGERGSYAALMWQRMLQAARKLGR